MKFFPYEIVRNEQDRMMEDIDSAIKTKSKLLAHAPTGIGKTAAVLAPAVEYARQNKKTVLFLTSRITQHNIVIETVKKINEKHGISIKLCDFVSKQKMCSQPLSNELFSQEFSSYCKDLVEENNCKFYNGTWNTSRELTLKSEKLVNNITTSNFTEVIEKSREISVCPYEITGQIARKADIIIGDYYHLFSPSVRAAFLNRIGKNMEDLIVIVDEAHNLPARLQDLLSARLTNIMLFRAIKEANTHEMNEVYDILQQINVALESFKSESEIMISKEVFIRKIENETKMEFDKIIEQLEEAGEEVRREQPRSNINGVVYFLDSWNQENKAFVRILKTENKERGDIITLTKHCLDPSIISSEIFEEVHCNILMSGTLTPLQMYADLLGIKNPILKEYSSPFSKENRLNLIIPKTSTKYTMRTDYNYEQIAHICSELINSAKVNSIIFFPSYYILNEIYNRLDNTSNLIAEQRGMSAENKNSILAEFKQSQNKCLLACIGGSFSEGIDLPGKQLELVIVVGIPLERPTLEVESRIKYYDNKFKKGWDYAYTYPAINKAQQAAGRCIRTHTDKGVIVFLDERYGWSRYNTLFPKDWDVKVSYNPVYAVKDFFL